MSFYREVTMEIVVIHNMVALAISPNDPTVSHLLVEAALLEFETHTISSHLLLTMGIFYGETQYS